MEAVASNIQSLKLIAHSIDKSRFGGGERVNDVTRKRRSFATFCTDKSFASSSSSSCNVWGRSDLLKGGKISTPSIGTCCRSHRIADFAPTTSAAYGTLLLGGGLFAYTKSGSKGSLLGGLLGATLMCAVCISLVVVFLCFSLSCTWILWMFVALVCASWQNCEPVLCTPF